MQAFKRNKAFATVLTGMLLSLPAEPVWAKTNVDDLIDLPLAGLLNREVSVASKREEKVREAPGVVTIIDHDEIQRYGGRTLTDILQRLPSVNIGGGSIYRNNVIVVRGQGDDIDTQNLLLINGRPFRDMVSSGIHSPVYQTFPVETIDHIEVIRGPGSVLYGTNAFTGVINIVTKTPDKPTASVSGTYGSDDYRRGELYAAQTFENGHVMVGATRTSTDGWDFTVSDVTHRTGTQPLPESSFSGYMQGQYKDFTFSAFSGYENQAVLGVAPILPLDTAKNNLQMVDLGYKHAWSENWTSQANLTYNGHKQIVQDLQSGFDGVKPQSDGLLAEVSLTGAVTSRLNVLIGATHEHYNASMKEIGGEYDTDRSSGYMQVDYRPWDPLKLIGGVQINKVQGLDYSTSPRVGAIYNFTDNIGVKALYSEAYKAPVGSITVLNTPFVRGNPNLKPEVIQAYDLQLFYE